MSSSRRSAVYLVRMTLRLLLLLLLATPASAALRFVAELDGLDAAESEFTRELTRAAQASLPPQLKAQLDVAVPL